MHLLTKLFAQYASAFYPRWIQAIVGMMRYLVVLALVSLLYENISTDQNSRDMVLVIANGLAALVVVIPICLMARLYFMHCGKDWV